MRSFPPSFIAISLISIIYVHKVLSTDPSSWTGRNIYARGGGVSRTSSSSSRPRYYDTQNDDDDGDSSSRNSVRGLGREFNLFSGNLFNKNNPHHTDDKHNSNQNLHTTDTDTTSSSFTTESYTNPKSNSGRTTTYSSSSYSLSSGQSGGRRRRTPTSTTHSRGGASSTSTSSSSRRSTSTSRNPFTSIKTWITENQASIPRIQVRVEPNTTLKLRKRFRPLFKTVVTLGADFNTQLGVWQFKSSWEDSIIGGRLMLAGRELQLSKTWLLSVGAVEDLVTRLRFRAAIDLGTGKAYARFGFRTERLSPINVMEGFTLLRQLPLDGPDGHVKLEVKANFAFPEPEIEYSTERGGRSIIGMGDIEVNLDELNLLLDY